MDDIIYFYRETDKYGDFSNYFPSSMIIDNVYYQTVEHYYQAQKYVGDSRHQEYAQLIIRQNTPNKAKILANKKVSGHYSWMQPLIELISKYKDVKIRDDWDQVKDNVMRKGVFNKYLQNSSLLDNLKNTGSSILIEHSYDKYWGDGLDGSGLNKLGTILMEIRSILQCQTIPIKLSPYYWFINNIILVIKSNEKTIIDFDLLTEANINIAININQCKIEHPLITDVASIDKSLLSQLIVDDIGKSYNYFIYGAGEQYHQLLTLILIKLYGLTNEIASHISETLIT